MGDGDSGLENPHYFTFGRGGNKKGILINR